MTPGPPPRFPVTTIAFGPWREPQVRLEPVPPGRRLLPEVEHAIDAAWSEGLARTKKLFDGPMCRLESFAATPASLTVRVSRTSYKPFYGTNLYRPHLRDQYGPDVMANPIGLSPALLTADHHLVFGRRNHAVAYYPGRVHPFSGSLEPGESPFDGVRRELAEELALTPADLSPDLTLLGIVEDHALRQPEFIFGVTVAKTLAELHVQLDQDEHHAIAEVPANVTSLTDALRSPDFTPVAIGTLLLFARAQGWSLPS